MKKFEIPTPSGVRRVSSERGRIGRVEIYFSTSINRIVVMAEVVKRP